MSIQDVIKDSILKNFAFDQVTMVSMALGMVAALAMGCLIYLVYSKCYTGVIYSRSFAITLVGMTVLTAMVTLAISTNIVISLGMVGALSIVRFRTAIKDPLDLLYIFWAITSGIAAGANMYLLVVITAVVMILLIVLLRQKQHQGRIYIVIVHFDGPDAEDGLVHAFGRLKYFVKSKTLRQGSTELAVEVFCKHNDTAFLERIRKVPGVQDATLIQYNGEYHG